MGGGVAEVQALGGCPVGGTPPSDVIVKSDLGWLRWSSLAISGRITSGSKYKRLLPWNDRLLSGLSGARPPIVKPGQTRVAKSLDSVAAATARIAKSTAIVKRIT